MDPDEAPFDPETTFSAPRMVIFGRRLTAWAAQDPAAAFAVFDDLPAFTDEDRREALSALVRGVLAYGGTPSPEVIQTIERLPVLKTRGVVMEVLVAGMLGRDGTEKTRAFIESLGERPSPGLASEFFRTFVTVLATRDPEAGIAFANAHAQGRFGRNLRRRLGARWGHADGVGAMEWARSLPAGGEREDVLDHTYRTFTRRNPQAAVAWMSENRHDPSLAVILPKYLVFLAREDPETAAGLLPKVTSSKYRNEIVAKVAKQWLRLDPDAAKAWMESIRLPRHEQSRILRSHEQSQEPKS